MGVGAFLKDPAWLGALLFVSLAIFVYVAVRVEERDNLDRFGLAYREYMAETKMFILYEI